MDNLSYNQVIDRLQAFADGHEMIATFGHGLTSLIDRPKNERYPVMHVVPVTIEIGKGVRRFTFDIMFFDLPRSQEDDNEYQREVISDCARLAEHLIYAVDRLSLFGREVTVSTDHTIDPFINDYSQVVTGVTLSGFSIEVPNDWNACDIPAIFAPNGSGSGGSGTSSGGVTLKVNGVNNAVQNVLDLVQGTNIVIEDLGDGRVRIRATGGGGGGSDWGSIGGDIDDQTDLIARLDAIIASVTAEAAARISGDSTNASAIAAEAAARASADTTLQNNINSEVTARTNADTALQTNIDQVAADLVTETTARQSGDATNAADLTNHVNNTSNPHSVTKAQVGLGNVDNTSDANKPISAATQTALNAKEPTITAGTTSQYYRGDKTFQTLDKTAVGLGNVDNTSDANKPVSTAQAAAIALKQDTLVSGTNIKTINGNSLLGSGNIAINSAFRTFSTALTLAASSGDRFYTMQNGANSGTESAVTMSAEFAMTITEIRVRTTTTQGNGTLVFTLRRAGADTALVLTIAASAVAGVYTVTGSIAIAQGDLICMKIRNNSTATSANMAQISISYQ